MVYKIADNILSPLGETTAQNYQAVKAGRSAIRTYAGLWDLHRPLSAACFSDTQNEAMALDGLSPFESLVAASVSKALQHSSVDVSQPGVILIVGTTKGNVELLSSDDDSTDDASQLLGVSIRKVARRLGFTTEPVVCCNACISGLSALLLASRLLETGAYDVAVVCGADRQSRFIASGFQSFQVVSPEACRPFDMERTGLSLGEAAATMVLSRRPGQVPGWAITSGAVTNDATHVSTPAADGRGACLALQRTVDGFPAGQLAFVNAHGTATMFNDQMESVAIVKAGLASVPVNSYKGYYGHTMGAAGVLETVLSMAALDDHTVIGTRGFAERGVSGDIRLSAAHQPASGQAFVKMLSGFGGCNAALLAVRQGPDALSPARREPVAMTLTHRVVVTPERVSVDGRQLTCEGTGREMLSSLYRRSIGDYPKYHKMDRLSQLGFVASELLLQATGETTDRTGSDGRAIVLFNRSSSRCADRKYLGTIAPDDFFPSPSLFVYTLPNIVAGEIAIRNGYRGETSFYILPERNEQLMQQILRATSLDPATKSILGGWIDCEDDTRFAADLFLMETV